MKKVISILLLIGMVSFCVLHGDLPASEKNHGETADTIATMGETQPVAVAETEAETVEAAIEEVSVIISFAGDCSLGRLSIHGYEGTFYEMYDLYGPSYFFQDVKPVFESDDMTLVNFEGVLTDSNELVEKAYNIKGEEEYNQILTEGNIEAVSFGNNHRIDYGQEGIEDTIAAFQEANVTYAYDDILGMYETDDGVLIGFVSVNEVYDDTLVEQYLEEGIASLKQKQVDLIIACCHWGIELDHYPEEYQTELGKKCIDLGADIVVGTHPHVLQGIDYYNGKYIIYSLGNFCFGGNRNPKDKNSMILQAKFTLDKKEPAKEAQLTVIPCTISSVLERNDYCPTLAEGEKKAEIIQLLNEYSTAFPIHIAENGQVTHE